VLKELNMRHDRRFGPNLLKSHEVRAIRKMEAAGWPWHTLARSFKTHVRNIGYIVHHHTHRNA
jgi:hypothetical protein